MRKSTICLFSLSIGLFLTTTKAQNNIGPLKRNIPDTENNKQYFDVTQSLIKEGEFKDDSCGTERDDIIECIKKCNQPGQVSRQECCCVARTKDDGTREFVVGLKDGCRYNQRVLNFTQSLQYSSTPISPGQPLFFDKRSCSPISENRTSDSCTCSMSWQLTAKQLSQGKGTQVPKQTSTPSITTEPQIESTEPTPSMTPEPDSTNVSSTPKEPATIPPPQEQTTTPIPEETSTVTSTPAAATPNDEDFFAEETTTTGEPSPTPEDDGAICVEESYLLARGIKRAHMIHQTPVLAQVVCPNETSLPCGTRNHMVRYNNMDMSYEQLCAQFAFKCKPDVRYVNSVYTHIWTEINHDGVTMTMYDVRYPEISQRILHKAMHGWRIARESLRSYKMYMSSQTMTV